MVKNFSKIAFRNMLKHPGITFINVSGLALGMACCMLLSLFIKYELEYDTFNTNYSRIYRMAYQIENENGNSLNIKSPEPLARAMMAEFPQVEKAGRLFPHNDISVRNEDIVFIENNIFAADPEIMNIFSFNLVAGNPGSVLSDPFSVVVTEEIAYKYFKDANAVGKTLIMFDKPVRITGVMKRFPSNSHFHPEFLISYNSFPQSTSDSWQWTDPRTYFLLKEGSSVDAITRKLAAFTQKHNATDFKFVVQPLSDVHLRSNYRGELEANGSESYTYIMGIIAVFILTIACINFVNLSSARGNLRAKEVGVRKAMGAQKNQLVLQFIGESFLLTAISVLLALAITLLAIPLLNQVTDRSIELTHLYSPALVLVFIAIFVLVGVCSSIYPAFYLSGFDPIAVLKGLRNPTGGSALLRKTLVVFQFTVSILLVIGTLVVLKQLRYVENINLGFNQNQLVVIPIRGSQAFASSELIKNRLAQQPGVLNIAGASEYPGREYPVFYHWPEGQSGPMRLYDGAVGTGYFETMQMKLVAGRFFSEAYPSDSTTAVILNEEAVKIMGFNDNPLGKKVYDSPPQNEKRNSRTIVGVVKNFHSRSAREPIEPLFIIPQRRYFNVIARLETKNINATLAGMEQAFKQVAPAAPFEVKFLDETFAQIYQAEKNLALAVRIFAGLAIFISALGLLGLFSYTVERKAKEISIRKILGAQVSSIMYMLLRDSVKYVLIASLIATPLGFYTMNRWLDSYTYRTSLDLSIFLLASLLALSVAIFTTAYHVIKAALTNPIRSIQSE